MEEPLALDHDQVADLWLDPQVSDEHILYVQAQVYQWGCASTLSRDRLRAGRPGRGGQLGGTLELTVELSGAAELTVASLPAGSTVLLWRTRGSPRRRSRPDRLTAAAAAAGRSRLDAAPAQEGGHGRPGLGLTARELTFFASACPDTSGFLDAPRPTAR